VKRLLRHSATPIADSSPLSRPLHPPQIPGKSCAVLRFIFRNALAFLAFSILLSSVAAFAAPCGNITRMEGRVDVLRPGKNLTTQVSPGDPVEVGDIYRARTRSKAEVTFLNGNVLRIGQDTRVEIKEYMVEGGKSSNVVKLYRGRVQAVSADDLAKKIVAFAEGSKFEVHTENAVAGVRDTNMLVEFEGSTTIVILLFGRGYVYNPQEPGVILPLNSGYTSTVSGPFGTPSQPKPASDDLIKRLLRWLTFSNTPPAGPVPTPPLPVDPADVAQFIQDMSLLLSLQGSTGASNYWTGGSGNWSDGAKWSLGYPPLAGSVWLMGGAGNVIYDVTSPAAYSSVTVDSKGGGPMNLSVGQGVLASLYLTVGQFHAGILNLSGGSVVSQTIVIGMHDGSTGAFNHGYAEGVGPTTGSVLVTGNLYIGGGPVPAVGGSGTYNLYAGVLDVGGNTYVGYSGKGYFNQGVPWGAASTPTPGGTFQTTNLYLGWYPGSQGAYTLANGNLTVTRDMYVGCNGTGSFYQSGGSVKVDNNLTIGSTGSYDFEGGQLQVTGTLFDNGSLTVNGNPLRGDLFQVGSLTEAGWLQGSGVINGNVSIAGGVHPGNSPGVLTIAGNYTQSAGSTLNIDIGNGGYSELSVTGKANLAGYLNVSLLTGVRILNGETFDIVNAADLLSTLIPEGPLLTGTNGFHFSIETTGNDIFLIADGNYGTSTVPLPSGLFLFAPGLAGLAALRRRFRK
jgi:hypothetical protein